MCADHPQRIALAGAFDHLAPSQNPVPLTVFRPHPKLDFIVFLQTVQGLLDRFLDRGQVFRMQQTAPGLEVAMQFPRLIAQHGHVAGTEVHFAGLDVPIPKAVFVGFHCALETLLALAQRSDVFVTRFMVGQDSPDENRGYGVDQQNRRADGFERGQNAVGG